MQVTLLRDPYCEFIQDEILTLIEGKLGEMSIVLVAMGEEASKLADYAIQGMTIEIESGKPPQEWNAQIYQSARSYRWDWNLTPDTETLFAIAVKISQRSAATVSS